MPPLPGLAVRERELPAMQKHILLKCSSHLMILENNMILIAKQARVVRGIGDKFVTLFKGKTDVRNATLAPWSR